MHQRSGQVPGPGSIPCLILEQKFKEKLKVTCALLLLPANVRVYFVSADALYTLPSYAFFQYFHKHSGF